MIIDVRKLIFKTVNKFVDDEINCFKIDRSKDGILTNLLDLQDQLEWDDYVIISCLEKKISTEFPDVYKKELVKWQEVWNQGGHSIDFWTGKVDQAILDKFSCLKPFRKRAILQLELSQLDSCDWKVEVCPSDTFAQNVDDIRSRKRFFKQLRLKKDQLRIIAGIAVFFANSLRIRQTRFWPLGRFGPGSLIKCEGPLIGKIRCSFHMMQTFCFEGQETTPTPEGIHQDGVDYVLTGLVYERNNVTGGKSRVYEGKNKLLLEKELQVGEGIFHPDRISNYYHDVSPIRIENTELGVGTRSILGLDFNLEK